MTLPDINNLTIAELLAAHSSVIDELKRRGVIRSNNNPTGDYAEWLAKEKLGLDLETNSAKGFDALDSQGLRYQIKGRRVTDENGSTQLGVIRNLEAKEFDFLVGIIFDSNWQVRYAAKIPQNIVASLATFRDHQNGHVLHLRPSIFENPNVEDISNLLKI
jgi:hypothetical protein